MPLGQVSPPANRSTAGNNGDSTAPIQIPLVLVLVGDNLVKRANWRVPQGETDTSSKASGGGDGPQARNRSRQQRAAAAAGHMHEPTRRRKKKSRTSERCGRVQRSCTRKEAVGTEQSGRHQTRRQCTPPHCPRSYASPNDAFPTMLFC